MRQFCVIPARITPTLELSQLPSETRRFIAVGRAQVLPYCDFTTPSHIASGETEVRRMRGRVRRPREMDRAISLPFAMSYSESMGQSHAWEIDTSFE